MLNLAPYCPLTDGYFFYEPCRTPQYDVKRRRRDLAVGEVSAIYGSFTNSEHTPNSLANLVHTLKHIETKIRVT